MSKLKLREEITTALKKECGKDSNIHKFLVDLIYTEINSPAQFKDIYKEYLIKYSSGWRNNNEI